MNENSAALDRYFRKLKDRLDCPRADRARFLAQARDMAREFLDEQPDATPDMVEANVGSPEELARYFLDTLEPDALSRYRGQKNRRKYRLLGITAAIFLLLCAWIGRLLTQPVLLEATDTIVIYPAEELP